MTIRHRSMTSFDGDVATVAHFANFIAAIRKGEKPRSHLTRKHRRNNTATLSNIAWELNRELQLDPRDGNDSE